MIKLLAKFLSGLFTGLTYMTCFAAYGLVACGPFGLLVWFGITGHLNFPLAFVSALIWLGGAIWGTVSAVEYLEDEKGIKVPSLSKGVSHLPPPPMPPRD